MRITMVKKKLADGSDCRKCAEASDHLRSRGLGDKIDEVIWAEEGNPASAGMILGARYGVERAPFFIVRDDTGHETVYTSVLQLVRRLGDGAPTADQARTVDPDDVGGI